MMRFNFFSILVFLSFVLFISCAEEAQDLNQQPIPEINKKVLPKAKTDSKSTSFMDLIQKLEGTGQLILQESHIVDTTQFGTIWIMQTHDITPEKKTIYKDWDQARMERCQRNIENALRVIQPQDGVVFYESAHKYAGVITSPTQQGVVSYANKSLLQILINNGVEIRGTGDAYIYARKQVPSIIKDFLIKESHKRKLGDMARAGNVSEAEKGFRKLLNDLNGPGFSQIQSIIDKWQLEPGKDYVAGQARLDEYKEFVRSNTTNNAINDFNAIIGKARYDFDYSNYVEANEMYVADAITVLDRCNSLEILGHKHFGKSDDLKVQKSIEEFLQEKNVNSVIFRATSITQRDLQDMGIRF